MPGGRRCRARDLGIVPGPRRPGRCNAITDVPCALAFSTAPPATDPLPDSGLDPLFGAAIDVTEEAILNSLTAADSMTGFRGHVRHAVPLDRVRQLCLARGVLASH